MGDMTMNENEIRCSTTEPIQTLSEALYLLAMLAALLIGAFHI